jgi:ABC-type dipeptide/oligopeptide/nickel transport system permease component
MSYVAARLLRIPLVVAIVGGALAIVAPTAMRAYEAFPVGRAMSGLTVSTGPFGTRVLGPSFEQPLATLYRTPFSELMIDATGRSLVLLAGAAVLALVLGAGIGITLALMRRRAIASGSVVGMLALMAAIPSFFVAYFLQIFVIVVGAGDQGERLLPVFGFGYDEHIVLPLLAISIPAIAYTAQLVSTRMQDVLDAEFVTTANAKGLLQSRIVLVHVLPHVRPVLFEALGSGLRVSVASLPIIEILFVWNGIGALALQAVGAKDSAAFVFTAVVLVAVFAVLGAIADLSRPRMLYRPA